VVLAKKAASSAKIIISVVVVAYFALFSILSILQYRSFHNFWALDFGIRNQTLWRLVHGKGFFQQTLYANRDISYLAISHLDLVMLLLAPVYYLLPFPETLLIIQTFSFALAILLIFVISKRIIGDDVLSLFAALSFAVNPYLHMMNLSDLRFENLGVLFILIAFWAVWEGQFLPFVLSSFLILSANEVNFLSVFFLGIWAVYRNRQFKWLIVSVLALVWFILAAKLMFVLLSRAGMDTGRYSFFNNFSYFGDQPVEIAINMISHPQRSFHFLFHPSKIRGFRKFFSPSLGVMFLSPTLLFLSLPVFFRNLPLNLAERDFFSPVLIYYLAALMPFVGLAPTFLIEKIKRYSSLVTATVVLLLVTSLHEFFCCSPLFVSVPFWRNPRFQVSVRDRIAWRIISRIPAKASVAAAPRFLVAISSREEARIMSVPVARERRVGYLLIDSLEEYEDVNDCSRKHGVGRGSYKVYRGYEIVSEDCNIYLLKLKAGAG